MLPKLVRDGVPQSILENRQTPITETAKPGDREDWLLRKLNEEIDEFKQVHDPMELIDIYEVLRSLWAIRNSDADISLSSAAAMKRETVGGFGQFIILTDIRPGRGT